MTNHKAYAQKILDCIEIEKVKPNLFFNFKGENSQFYRLNKSMLRQMTTVNQFELLVVRKNEKDEDYLNIQLTGNLDFDIAAIKELVPELSDISENNQFIIDGEVNTPDSDEFLANDFLESLDKEIDLVGMMTSGTISRGVAVGGNSKPLWFETDRSDIDYSIFNKDLCIKEYFSVKNLTKDIVSCSIKENKEKLDLLLGDKVELKPGEYKAYFSPSAVNEMLGMFNWNGIQGKAFAEKQSVFMDLFDKKNCLSKNFSLRENFDLKLSPKFNQEAQESETIIEIIKNGELINPLVSSVTERKFSLKSNQADLNEVLRSAEILPGNKSEHTLIKSLKPGLYISNLHYLNWSNRKNASITGMTRYGCLYIDEQGKTSPIKDMRFNMSLYDVFGNWLEELSIESKTFAESHTYGSRCLGGAKVPGILSKINFSL